MTNSEVATEFIRRFCAGDVEDLVPLLAEDLLFVGPLFQFDSSAGYLDRLRSDPPEPADYEVLNIAENSGTVSVFWNYIKSDDSVTIAQLFKLRDQIIAEILLVFDGRGNDD